MLLSDFGYERQHDREKLMPAVLTHIAMHVQDLDACVDFYHHYADMNIIHERPHKHGEVKCWRSGARKRNLF